ncbi:hypothetical protein GF351_05805 [Candidatus Woesearchaeota archaeon]|nr:hypothetical protein [Candidatus Woesearchaeota archaeon]
MSSKSMMLAAALIAVCLLAGCRGGGSGSILDPEDVRKGTKGLEMDFIERNPPDEIYEDSTFSLGIELENQGAADITQGILKVGIDRTFMEWDQAPSQVSSVRLEGKTVTRPSGEQDFLNFRLYARPLPPNIETHTTQITVTSCYDYKTIAAFDVCIDTDIYGQGLFEKACEVEDLTSSGQGGPVAVTRAEPTMLPHEKEDRIMPQFRITVANKGGGRSFRKDLVKEMCTGATIDIKGFNTAEVNAYLSEEALECRPHYVNLEERDAEVVCALTEGIPVEFGSYKTPLTVTIDYGYTDSMSKQVEIKDVR